ncbi:MAG: sugar phosphate isomerase/epimerase [Anaerolineae bacterium]|nr:MAG: sugar phosphate isomerase/epimerase [Anaerolineae bacterium]
MNITGISINGDTGHLGGSLGQLADDLVLFQRCGFDGVELSAPGLDVVIHGRLQKQQVERVQAIVKRFDFSYTVHAPNRLNLAFPQKGANGTPELTLEQDVFVACLDFCAAIGARIMVYHSGLIALHGAAFGLAALPDDEALELARQQEVSALRALMPLAAERGVMVAMENRDPHPWEIATLLRAGVPADQLLKYHAGLSIPDLVRQMTEVNHPSLSLTLDFAHLFLAANHCGFDYLEAVRQAAPYIGHLHSHDSFGRLGGTFDDLDERIPYGDGDLHLPPGWGAIPHVETLAQLGEYTGLCVLEIRPRFREHLVEALETMRRIIAQVTAEVA